MMEDSTISNAEELPVDPDRKELIRSFVQRTLPTHMSYSADFINNLEMCLTRFIQLITITAEDQARIIAPARTGHKRIGPPEVVGALDNTGFHEFSSLLGKYAKRIAEPQMLRTDDNGDSLKSNHRSKQATQNDALSSIVSAPTEHSVDQAVEDVHNNNDGAIKVTIPSNTEQSGHGQGSSHSSSSRQNKDRSSLDGASKKFSTKGLPKGPYPKRRRIGI